MIERLDREHGSPYDRGSADSWYRRGKDPHYYVGKTGSSRRIDQEEMTAAELDEYNKGFDENEEAGNHKYD